MMCSINCLHASLMLKDADAAKAPASVETSTTTLISG